MSITREQAQNVVGNTVFDASGDKIGKLNQVYLDDATGEVQWATVNTGLFGSKESFVPLTEATMAAEGVTVPFEKGLIKGAPSIDADAHLDQNEEQELYRYYGVDYNLGNSSFEGNAGTVGSNSGIAGTETRDGRTDFADSGSVGHDTSGPNTDNAMTLSEERLRVGTEKQNAGRARLRKFVVTENVTQTVPVSHEEVRIEREPITDANVGNALDGPDLSEETHEVTLHAEKPVVAKETVPVERVRLDTENVTENVEVSESVRKEAIDTDEIDRVNSRNSTQR